MRHGHYDEYVRVSSSKNTIFHLVSSGPLFQLWQSNRECGALMAEFPSVTIFLLLQPVKHILTHHNHAHKGQPVHAIAQRLPCDHLSRMIC